jgi:cytochrome P450
MGRRVGDLVMDLWDEVGAAIDDTWGSDTEEWKDISVFDNMMHIIARASNRVFIGLPLCRNEAYLKSMEAFAGDVSMAIIFMRFVPKILEPIMGRLITIPNGRHYRQSAALHLPTVKERLANLARNDADSTLMWDEPNDYLSWHIRQAQKEGNTAELEPDMISKRLMPLNFGAIHTTVFTITNCLFDVLAAPSSSGTGQTPMESIRVECMSEFARCKGQWTKSSISHLIKTDSVIRESMRVSGFLTRALQRKVVAREGLENKRLGLKLPYGSTVSVDAYGIMLDENKYADAKRFDAFRFARQREQDDASGSESGDDRVKTALESKQLSCSSTSETFLTFGHGRHACPGRFLVAQELKLLLAYASMHYEIEPLATRPPNTWFGAHILPPMKATIRVRRRKPT